ncbi:DUF2960 domain-containing protein [Thalassotalea sp. ND16A]|uniref:DUF2960 domain-containing protein n=1 Tax=Thalassotalea sp. ND16A TaxID=1535422 RepID=UPI000519FE21|nr:DUF2960 domain-containing protein [Thalassotalea sp. ND16A]KGK00422.1 hypothetical protein ND16A_3499 [Thalassotalea sp. ND16A]
MARVVTYKFNGVTKTIPFSFSRFHDMYEAAAAAEGVDIKNFLAMEQQLELTSRGQGIVKNFRQKEFARMGFSDIAFVREEE